MWLLDKGKCHKLNAEGFVKSQPRVGAQQLCLKSQELVLGGGQYHLR